MSALRTIAAVGASSVLVLLTTGAGGAGVRPGTAEGAELVKTGWWWVANETPLDETVVAPPQPTPPNVPKGTLPVSAAGGEPEKYAALEFKLDAEAGSFVESAVLVLKENADPGATVNVEGAKILACPVTEGFWADGASGAWKARPTYDCDLASAAGERDAKSGLWTFDLTSVAALWVAEGHNGSTSVALVEGGEAPESFQVAFDGPKAKGVGFSFAFGDPPPPLGDLPAAGAGTPADSGGAPAASSGSMSGSAGTSTPAEAPLAGTADVAPADVPTGEASTAPTATAATDPVSAPTAIPAWYSGVPRAGYVLVPLAIGLAYLVMLALGPEAQPAAGPTQHGVGRALERLRTVGSNITKGKS